MSHVMRMNGSCHWTYTRKDGKGKVGLIRGLDGVQWAAAQLVRYQVWIRIWICTCMYTYIYFFPHLGFWMVWLVCYQVWICLWICVCTYIYVCIFPPIRGLDGVRAVGCRAACSLSGVNMCMNMYMHVYIYIYIPLIRAGGNEYMICPCIYVYTHFSHSGVGLCAVGCRAACSLLGVNMYTNMCLLLCLFYKHWDASKTLDWWNSMWKGRTLDPHTLCLSHTHAQIDTHKHTHTHTHIHTHTYSNTHTYTHTHIHTHTHMQGCLKNSGRVEEYVIEAGHWIHVMKPDELIAIMAPSLRSTTWH